MIAIAATVYAISLCATPPTTERRVAWAWAEVSNPYGVPCEYSLPCLCGHPMSGLTSGWVEPWDTVVVRTRCIVYDLVRRCPADLDRDNDVDESDYGLFAGCWNGTGNQYPPPCKASDFDHDQDVDGEDYAYFASCMNGSGNPARCM